MKKTRDENELPCMMKMNTVERIWGGGDSGCGEEV